MTPEDAKQASTEAESKTGANDPNVGAVGTSSSKGFIATLAGAAAQLASSMRAADPALAMTPVQRDDGDAEGGEDGGSPPERGARPPSREGAGVAEEPEAGSNRAADDASPSLATARGKSPIVEDALDTEKGDGPSAKSDSRSPSKGNTEVTQQSETGSNMATDDATPKNAATEKEPSQEGGDSKGGSPALLSAEDDGADAGDDDSVDRKLKKVKSTVEAHVEKRREEELRDALDSLQEVSIRHSPSVSRFF